MLTSLMVFAQQSTSSYDAGKIAANVFVVVAILAGVLWVCKRLFKSQ